MTMPFYVSPEQLMKDRADFARKGIARGRSVAVLEYADGVLFVSENPSQALHKISEIYDRIAFAAVGRYNEFENLRIAGVRLADTRGFAYDRRDVTGRGLANAYAQTLGTIFSSGGEKPYEVELIVAEVGERPGQDQVFRLTYDGQVADEHDFAAMGGQAEQVTTYLKEHWRADLAFDDALRTAVAALGHGESGDRRIPVADLEVAVLDRNRPQQRKFRRFTDQALRDVLGDDPGAGGVPDEGPDERPDGGPQEPPGGPTAPDPAAAEPAPGDVQEPPPPVTPAAPQPVEPDEPADPVAPIEPQREPGQEPPPTSPEPEQEPPPVAPPLPPRPDRPDKPPLGG